MTNVYTQRLAALSWADSADHLVYTVPAGKSVVVRDIVVLNAEPVDRFLSLYVAIPGFGNAWLFYGDLSGNLSQHLELRQALNPGDAIRVNMPSASSHLLITGYVFDDAQVSP